MTLNTTNQLNETKFAVSEKKSLLNHTKQHIEFPKELKITNNIEDHPSNIHVSVKLGCICSSDFRENEREKNTEI